MIQKILVLISLLVIIGSVSAMTVTMPSNIYIFDKKIEVSLVVENHTDSDQSFAMYFYGPADYEFRDVPATIEANDFARIRVIFYPNQELAGQQYETSLITQIGNETITKKVTLIFRDRTETAGAGSSSTVGTSAGTGAFTGTTGFFTASAPSLELGMNVILIIIAAILLIAFISRFTKRMGVLR